MVWSHGMPLRPWRPVPWIHTYSQSLATRTCSEEHEPWAVCTMSMAVCTMSKKATSPSPRSPKIGKSRNDSKWHIGNTLSVPTSPIWAGHGRRHGAPAHEVCIGGWGDSPTGKSVSVSFRVRVVRASGRGEAAWAREARNSQRWGKLCVQFLRLRRGFFLGPFAAMRMDFKRKINKGMLYAWTLCGEVSSLCYMHGL